MATLAARLTAIREGMKAKAPAEAIELMHRATADLEASGQAERALGVGATWPAFELENQDGEKISSADLLAKGPLVVSFFRGHW